MQVSFTLTTELGTVAFCELDELEWAVQQDLVEWLELLIQTAAQSLLTQQIGQQEAAKVTPVISAKLERQCEPI